MASVYRVSYPPFQTAPENQYVSIQKYLSDLRIIGGSQDKHILQRVLHYLAPHLLIDNESGVPYIKKYGKRLKTPITQLLSYFFPIQFSAEMPLTAQPIDGSDFLHFLKEIKLPASYLKMVVKNADVSQ